MVASLKFSFDRRSPSVFQHEEEEVRVSLTLWASRAGKENPTGTWSPAILSGDQFRPRFAARLAGFFLELALGAGPILERISGRAAALQIDAVGAQRDLLRCRMDPDRSRLCHCYLGTLARLGHTLLPSIFDCGFHFTFRGKPSLQNSLETQSKDSIH